MILKRVIKKNINAICCLGRAFSCNLKKREVKIVEWWTSERSNYKSLLAWGYCCRQQQCYFQMLVVEQLDLDLCFNEIAMVGEF